MEKVYIFGHKNPDTDSVTSAIALEYFKKKLGINAEARVLGELNEETKFVLNYFGIKEPKYLNDVNLKLKDISYYKDFFINESASIKETYDFISLNNVTGVPIVDKDNKFLEIVTAKTLLKNLFEENNNLNTTYENILKTLSGEEVLKYDDVIKGTVSAVSYKSTTFLEDFKLSNESILIVGDRHSIIESAVLNKVKLLIIVGNGKIKEEHIKIAMENKVNIIRTPYDTFKTIKKVSLSNSISNLLKNERSYVVYENEYYNDFLETAKELGFNNFPIVDKNNVCKGLYRLTGTDKKSKKKVILVDHSEKEQSVDGIDEAEITEIIDHHNLGNITTSAPLNFRGMAVGSTNTIVYFLFYENGILIPKDIAGIMLSGILSDTLALTSPTTTDIDKNVVEKLALISGVDYKVFSKEMFTAGSNFTNKTPEEIINIDNKAYQTNDKHFKVSQVTTTCIDEILDRKEGIIHALEDCKQKNNLDFVLFLATDIFENGSYLFFTEGMEKILEKIYDKEIKQGVFIEGCVSRKKQVVPAIMDFEEE